MRAVERIRGATRPSDVPVLRRSGGAGPVVVVTAGVHGDELVGFAACHELDRRLVAVRGEVVIYPMLNPAGLAARTRALPDDGGDLNRAFPGEANGSPAERHAARIWRDIEARRPDALVDLHADAATAIPYALVDRAISAAAGATVEARSVALAQASGLTVLREYPADLYRRLNLDRSLAGAAMNHLGIPSVTLEVGARRVIDAEVVARAVAAVIGVLVALGSIDGSPAASLPSVRQRGNAPRARAAGVFVPELAPGAAFARGSILGRVIGVDGTELDALRADAAGIVVAWAEGGWIEVGGIPGTLGLEEQDG